MDSKRYKRTGESEKFLEKLWVVSKRKAFALSYKCPFPFKKLSKALSAVWILAQGKRSELSFQKQQQENKPLILRFMRLAWWFLVLSLLSIFISFTHWLRNALRVTHVIGHEKRTHKMMEHGRTIHLHFDNMILNFGAMMKRFSFF